MSSKTTTRRMCVCLATWLGMTGLAGAGPFENWWNPHHCPQPSYCKLYYWAPTLACIRDGHHGPAAPTFAADRYPGLPIPPAVLPFGCPPVEPAALYPRYHHGHPHLVPSSSATSNGTTTTRQNGTATPAPGTNRSENSAAPR